MFLLGIANAHSRRACELVAAYEEHEITSEELGDTIGRLPSEALQVVATILSCWANAYPERSARMLSARNICSELARTSRSLN